MHSFLMRARSSAVEHYGDIVGVAGSNPAAPTIKIFIALEFNYESPHLLKVTVKLLITNGGV